MKEYDWFVKADDDTFLIIENLRKFVSRLTPSQPLWFGFKLRDKNMKQVSQTKYNKTVI
jgi:glycoprotein-N-acetylgalactosamine 3-beta-galactosyltransferase